MERENREEYGPELAARAADCWADWGSFREERLRNKRFTYGDQWGDRVEEHGVLMSEEDVIRGQGNIPLKNNLIRRLVRNVLGVFRERWQVPRVRARDGAETREALTMKSLVEYNMEVNRMEEVYARTMEEFLISGLAVHKKWYGRKGSVTDCWTDIVSPSRFFIDCGSGDFRSWDTRLVGEYHDMDLESLCAMFARSGEDERRLRRMYGGERDCSGKMVCRVLEVWNRRPEVSYIWHDFRRGRMVSLSPEEMSRGAFPGARRVVEDVWRYHFLTPEGVTLASGRSPYIHKSHPYIFKAYPFIDGEIHSFVGDVIDQQKLTNRLISMYDWILRASAKGVLLFPEGALPEGGSMEEVCDEWGRFNGVIVYRPRPGIPIPQQVSSKATDIGITELLDIQLRMMEDISGVNGALQGKVAGGSVSGTLYESQTRNALTSLTDLLRSFDDFIREGTMKDISNIRQYYTPQRIARICGGSGFEFTDTFRGMGAEDFKV